ncbi:MAG TPA: type IX secretion system membrane protein PorP/SprF [Cryomorphaceae bacterium]|nr:type IX secretion system membrane protein PorP/SprF [Cryomorphaceae bacterium]
MHTNAHIKHALAVLFVVTGISAFAQQQPLRTMYMWNPLIINPAYAGARDALTISGTWREQWVGLDGAPSTQLLSVHSPLTNNKVGLGFTIQNDNIGPTNTTGIWGDFAYKLRTSATSRLSFALRAGFDIHQADLRSLAGVEENDPAFDKNVENNLLPNFGFGVWYESERGYIGLAAPIVLENELNRGNNAGSGFNDLTDRHFYLMGGYVFQLDPDSGGVIFKPSAVIRAVNGAPVSFDISANFLIKDKLWIGGAYRFEDAFAAMLGFRFTPHLQAGYSYDFGTSELHSHHNGSHEFMLTYDFFKSKAGRRSPRYF